MTTFFVRHTFLINTYGAPDRAVRQVRALDHPLHRIFIHWDKKTPLDREAPAFQELAGNPRVHVLPDSARVTVQWGSIRIVDAILALMRAALPGTAEDEYLHLLSGECMPAKSNEYLHQFFEAHRGTEFLSTWSMPPKRDGGWGPNRYDKFLLHEFFNPRSSAPRDVLIKHLNGLLRKAQRVLKPLGIYRRYPARFPRLWGGWTWWSLTAPCCRYWLQYWEKRPDFVRRMRYTFATDEMAPHSIIMASPFAGAVRTFNLRYAPMIPGPATHARALIEADYEAIQGPDILIARKFTPESEGLIRRMEREVWGRMVSSAP